MILFELGILRFVIFFLNPKKNMESLIINKNPNESNWEALSVSGTPPAPHTYIFPFLINRLDAVLYFLGLILPWLFPFWSEFRTEELTSFYSNLRYSWLPFPLVSVKIFCNLYHLLPRSGAFLNLQQCARSTIAFLFRIYSFWFLDLIQLEM